MRRTLSAMILFVCGGIAMSSASFAKPPEVGDTAPPFELKGSDGETYRLADFEDDKVVLMAWFPKAFTGG